MTTTRNRAPEGDAIAIRNGRLYVPDMPIIPYVEGDGTGPDIWRACAFSMRLSSGHTAGGGS